MKKISRFYKNISWSDSHWLLFFFLAAVFLWMLGLGNVPLRDWDEGSHAIVAREIYRQGNWLHLTYFDTPYFIKPPLVYWLIAIGYHLWGGVGEFSSRVNLAFLTACGVPLLYLLGREIFSRRLEAILSALVYLTLLPVLRHGRLVMLDGIINTFFIFLLLCLLKERKKQIWALGIGICLGLITLTKGILVLALWAIAGLFVLVDRQWKLFVNPYAWLGLILGIAIAVPWYWLQWETHGDFFIELYFKSQSLERLSSAVEGNAGTPWYYLIELGKYSMPWLSFLPGGLWLAGKHRGKSWSNLVLIGTILFLGTISLMQTKLPWYIMPYYPFFALTVGAYLAYLWQEKHAYSRFFVGLFSIFSLVACGGFIYFLITHHPLTLILMSVTIAGTMGLTTWWLWERDRRFMPTLFIGLYLSLALLMLSPDWLWEINEQYPVLKVAAIAQKYTPEKTIIYTSFPHHRPSLEFYSDRQILSTPPDTLQQLWETGQYLLLDRPTFASLKLPDTAILGEAILEEDEDFVLVKNPVATLQQHRYRVTDLV